MHKALESIHSTVKFILHSTDERWPLRGKTRPVYSECQNIAAVRAWVANCIWMLYFVEVLLEALYLSVDPYMRYCRLPQFFLLFVGPSTEAPWLIF